MRRILFRGKQIDNEDWVLGYLWVGNENSYIIPHSLGVNYCEKENRMIAFAREVDPETVCQYTGLNDKNGMKIFEGDIVSAWSEGSYAIGRVKQRTDGLWLFYPAWQNRIMWGLCPNDKGETTVEVIGNIFDNPKLMEK